MMHLVTFINKNVKKALVWWGWRNQHPASTYFYQFGAHPNHHHQNSDTFCWDLVSCCFHVRLSKPAFRYYAIFVIDIWHTYPSVFIIFCRLKNYKFFFLRWNQNVSKKKETVKCCIGLWYLGCSNIITENDNKCQVKEINIEIWFW